MMRRCATRQACAPTAMSRGPMPPISTATGQHAISTGTSSSAATLRTHAATLLALGDTCNFQTHSAMQINATLRSTGNIVAMGQPTAPISMALTAPWASTSTLSTIATELFASKSGIGCSVVRLLCTVVISTVRTGTILDRTLTYIVMAISAIWKGTGTSAVTWQHHAAPIHVHSGLSRSTITLQPIAWGQHAWNIGTEIVVAKRQPSAAATSLAPQVSGRPRMYSAMVRSAILSGISMSAAILPIRAPLSCALKTSSCYQVSFAKEHSAARPRTHIIMV
mmetsp:Transcript_22365/g.47746  ORF Transcript_22365/g.47746 Transcript_22365/m.47746 type:complete len:280 (-) Transcript_22365:751-1590(-)